MPYKVINGKIENQKYTSEEVLEKLSNDQIKFIDLQFTGLYGRFHHITTSANILKQDDFKHGLPKVDGSSIQWIY